MYEVLSFFQLKFLSYITSGNINLKVLGKSEFDRKDECVITVRRHRIISALQT